MLESLPYIFGMFGALALSAFWSATEISTYSVSDIRLEVAARQNNSAAKHVLALISNPGRLVMTILIMNNVANYLLTDFFTSALQVRNVVNINLWSTLINTPLCLLFGEILPKRLAVVHANQFLLNSYSVSSLALKLCSPFTRSLLYVAALPQKLFNRGNSEEITPITGRTRLTEHLTSITAEGYITPEHRAMLDKVMAIESQAVEAMLTPINKLPCIVNADDQIVDAAKCLTKLGLEHSLVVDKQGNPLLKVFSLDSLLYVDKSTAVKDTAWTPLILTQKVSIADALFKMREAQVSLALIVGKRQQVIGLLTQKGILEMISMSLTKKKQ